jgi:hypothetical protein
MMHTMTTGTTVANAITEDEVDAFTWGDCWALASKIHKVHGLPIAVIAAYDPRYTAANYRGSMTVPFFAHLTWVHAFNVRHDGNYVDITGVYNGRDLYEQWEEHLPYDREDMWSGIHVAQSEQEVESFFGDQERLYPEVDVDESVQKVYSTYILSRH